MKYSFIIPVFNRPEEVDELLKSLTAQTVKDFEVIIVEDGSTRTCKSVCEGYSGALDIQYFMKKNSGPGQSALKENISLCSTLTWCCPRAISRQ